MLPPSRPELLKCANGGLLAASCYLPQPVPPTFSIAGSFNCGGVFFLVMAQCFKGLAVALRFTLILLGVLLVSKRGRAVDTYLWWYLRTYFLYCCRALSPNVIVFTFLRAIC